MKIKLKTQFWQETRLETWRDRYERISYWLGFTGMTNMGYGIWTNQALPILAGILPFTLAILVILSRKQYNTTNKKKETK